jgi:hypothetical protein
MIIVQKKTLYVSIKSPSDNEETRTPTGLLPLPPQGSVYTNFTTLPLFGLAKLADFYVFAKAFEHSQIKFLIGILQEFDFQGLNRNSIQNNFIMALELEGTLVKVLPEQTGSGAKGQWVKQDFVLETEEQYPKKACFSAWGDRAVELKQFALGDKLKVTFNAESREYNERWYTDLRAFRIELAGGAAPVSYNSPAAQPQATSRTAPPVADLPSFSEDDQDLPF